MSHEIHETDNFGHVGQPAWHGLGEQLPQGIDATAAFKTLGIDWGTELAPVKAVLADGTEIEDTGHRLHVRSDNQQVLGMVTDTYKSFENSELAEFADALAGQDAAIQIETAGTLFQSRRVFALVKLPKVVRATNEDVLHNYVLVSNGHGGVASFSVYPTSVRVVCANTLRYSERDAGRGISFRHTGDFQEKLKAARVVLDFAGSLTDRFQEQVSALVGHNLSPDMARHFMTKAWDLTYGTFKDEETKAKMAEKREAQVEVWLALAETEKNSMKGISGTLWSALNAYTEWSDHVRGRFKGDARVNSNLFGVSNTAKSKVFRHALSLV